MKTILSYAIKSRCILVDYRAKDPEIRDTKWPETRNSTLVLLSCLRSFFGRKTEEDKCIVLIMQFMLQILRLMK